MVMLPSPGLLQWLYELPSRRALHMLGLIEALLRKHREPEWPDRLSAAAGRLHAAHESGARVQSAENMHEILGFFGQPGSLRDVYLAPEAGHAIKPEDAAAVNEHLAALRTQLFLSARQVIARLEWRRRAGGG
jgi:hypothetical protein